MAGRTLGIAHVDLLSPTQAARSIALDHVFSVKPLTKTEETRWRALGKKGLSPGEFVNLTEALRRTPEHLTARLAGPQSLDEASLVPKDIAYYTGLVGPIPNGLLLDDTSREATHSYLLSEGDVGLRRIAHSSVSHALIPFEHLKAVSNAELGKLLELNNPFALVFGFEVCRFRLSQGDKAVVAEGTTFLKALFGSKSALRSRCELFTACALVTTVALRPIANAANAPLDWFRLAALSHAGVLTHALKHIRKPKDFLKWAWSQYAGSYWWHTVVDAQEEPRWEAEWLFPDGMIAELIGRCYQAMILLPKEDQPREWNTILNKARNGLKPKLRAFFPGPLDGFRPPLSQGERVVAAREEVRKVLSDRVSFADSPGLIVLAYSGAIDRELTKEIVRLLEASDEQLVNFETGFQILNCGAYVASTTRDEKLSQIVVARCARMIAPGTKSSEFLRILLLALRACSAYTDRSEYYRQISMVAAGFAYLASRETALEMSKSLEVLCHREIRLMGSLGRAIAILDAQSLAEKGS